MNTNNKFQHMSKEELIAEGRKICGEMREIQPTLEKLLKESELKPEKPAHGLTKDEVGAIARHMKLDKYLNDIFDLLFR